MAPQQRKNGGGKAKDAKGDDKKKDNDTKKEPAEKTFMEKHILKVQMGLMTVAFLASVVPRVLQGHDRYRFEDSYKDPVAWHRQFAKEYTSLFKEWGYGLHVNASERLQGLLVHAGVEAASARVLDVGAGTGLVGVELQRLGFQHVQGIDVVPEILMEANATGAYEHVVVADAEVMPMEFANSSFDVVLCIGTLGYLGRGEIDENGPALDHSRTSKGPQAEAARAEKLLKEWLRVLKPTGILGLTAEVMLKGAWEEAFHALQEVGLLKSLEVSGPLSLVPLNGDKYTAEEKAHMYFLQKPA